MNDMTRFLLENCNEIIKRFEQLDFYFNWENEKVFFPNCIPLELIEFSEREEIYKELSLSQEEHSIILKELNVLYDKRNFFLYDNKLLEYSEGQYFKIALSIKKKQ